MVCFILPYIDIDTPRQLRIFDTKPNIPYDYLYNKYCSLDELLHSWMEQNEIEYTLGFVFHLNEWRVCISNVEKATLFKLTWG